MRAANLAVRLVLELCLLAAVAYWGAGAGDGLAEHVALATVAPVLVAILWGLFVSQRAKVSLPRTAWVTVQLLLFGAGGAGLGVAGHELLGVAFVVAALVNLAVLFLLGQTGEHG